MSLLCAGVISPANNPVYVHAFAPPGVATAPGFSAATRGGDGKDGGGSELSLHHPPPGDPHAFLHILHCSLDAVEERLRATTIKTAAGGNEGGAVAGAGKGPKDPFLGMVYPTEDHRVYAYVTNTRARLLLLYDDRAEPAEGAVREVFRRLHAAYADAMSSPFAAAGQRIDSPAFATAVRALAAPLSL
mmetsp:Transcript_19973/g.32383  ORF Transcript_19973/g.32383 Transcript_19973/m.32383 type:complete len:188 (+) Transcript_19973:78-641(+)